MGTTTATTRSAVLIPVLLVAAGTGHVVLEANPVRFVAVTGLGGREKFPFTQFALVVEQVKTFWPATGFTARSWHIVRGWNPVYEFPFSHQSCGFRKAKYKTYRHQKL